jgi:hypothetical protein
VAVFELVPVLEADLEEVAVPVWDGVLDWEAERDPVMVLIDGATDEALTEALTDPPGDVALIEALSEIPAGDVALAEALTVALAEALTVALAEALTVALAVTLRVIEPENVELVH